MKHTVMQRFALLLLAAVFVLGADSAAAGDETLFRLPPKSLAKWYKPANERQVWLHTMFNLRTAMQAVASYAATGDRERAGQWAERLRKDYHAIPEMVPEWKVEVEPAAADALVAAVDGNDLPGIDDALHRLEDTCNGCHADYQSVAAVLYRGPDFTRTTVTDGGQHFSYAEAMERISHALSAVKIALRDSEPRRAQDALTQLGERLDSLSATCSDCHRDEAPQARIFAAVPDLLSRLNTALAGTDRREQGRLLGELGVSVCARCHGTHRTLSALRREFDR